MAKRHSILVSAIVLLTASLACSPSVSVPSADPNTLNTSIAQTVIARQTEAALLNPATATFTSTPETPTLTLEPTLSATPDFTSTPAIPLISVSVDTNCRTGPGAIFERVGILLVGETAEIVGREPKGEYWYIRNPDAGPEYCWVWGEYATISGNILYLQYMSPPSPPVTSFTVSFEKLETCTVWWVDFRIVNNSGAPFRSVSLTVSDAGASTSLSLTENKFTNNDGCGVSNAMDSVVVGGAATVSSPPFGYNPSGHNLNAKITVCTEANQQGACLTREITFTP